MIDDVIHHALKACVEALGAQEFGLRSHALPTEDNLDECVSAALSVTRALPSRGLQFIIGSSKAPSSPPPPNVVVLPPHAAAAEATRLRNASAPQAGPADVLVYLNTNSTPGEAGLSFLTEVTPDKVVHAYATSAGFELLAGLLERRSRRLRARLGDASIATLARFAEVAKAHGEAYALPVLGLLPSAKGAVPPGPRPARELDALRGAKATTAIRRARELLASLADDHADRALVPYLLRAEGDLRNGARRLTEAALRFSTGTLPEMDELCGMTVEFARLLRSGARDLEVGEEEGDEGDDGEAEAPDHPLSDAGLIEHPTDVLRAGAISASTEGDDPVPTLSIEVGETKVPLRAATPSGLLRALLALKDPEAFDAQVLTGAWLIVSDAELLRASRPRPGVTLRKGAGDIGEHLPRATPEVAASVSALLLAREAVVQATVALIRVADPPEDEEAEAEEGVGVRQALTLIDGNPAIVAARCEGAVRAYVSAYCAAVAAVFPERSVGRPPEQRVIEWLINLDLAVAIEGSAVSAARLLPLHPLRLQRALLWVERRVKPPTLPPMLVALFDAPERLLSDGVDELFVRSAASRPTPRGVELAIDQGVRALWAMLSPRGLLTALEVHFVDVEDVTDAADALCRELGRRFEEDTEVGDGVHVDVKVVLSDEGRAEEWRLGQSELSEPLKEALAAVRGEGLSLTLPTRASTRAAAPRCHLAIEAVSVPYYSVGDDPGTADGGLPLSYVPGPNGNVALVKIHGVTALDAYDRVIDEAGLTPKPHGLNPAPRDATASGAIVRALVARGGWPFLAAPDTDLVSYGEDDGHMAAVVCDRQALDRALSVGLSRVTTSAPGLEVVALREAVLALYSCRHLLASVLDELDERHLRGQIGLARAYLQARERDAVPRLPLSLDAPEGHRWVRAMQHVFEVDRSRTDLLILEAATPDCDAVGAIRVVELKASEKAAKFATRGAREGLSKQARTTAARVRACFTESAGELPKAALQRLAWMEAGRQRLAGGWRDALRDLERRLAKHECPRLLVELWVVPEQPWQGQVEHPEHFPMLDATGAPLGNEQVEVRTYIMQPLAITPPPRPGPASAPNTKPRPAAPTRPTAEPSQVQAPAVASAPLMLVPSPGVPLAATTEVAPAAPSDTNIPTGPHADTEGMVIRFGEVEGQHTPAVWTPNRVDRVNHYNVGITGTMGTGKTQLTKSFLAQLVTQGGRNPGGRPPGVLIFDYKGDYGERSRDDFPRRIGARVLKPERLPLNPLRPSAPSSAQDLKRMVYAFADTLLAIDGKMGRVQRDAIVGAVLRCVSAAGINPDDPSTFERPFPTLRDLLVELDDNGQAVGTPRSLVSEMVELGVFEMDGAVSDASDVFDAVSVIDLQPLAGMRQTIRAIVAFFLTSFYRQMNALGEAPLAPGAGSGRQLRPLRRLVLVDEADDFLSINSESLRQILQQGRSFGCGVVLSTQFLTHFDRGGEDLKSSIGTWVIHQMPNVDPKRLAALFSLRSRDEATALATRISALPKHTSLCRGLSNDGYRDRLAAVRDLPFIDLALP